MVVADETIKSQPIKSMLTTSSSSSKLAASKLNLAPPPYKTEKLEFSPNSTLDVITASAGSQKPPGMARIWSKVEISLENSLLSEERLDNPPSLTDGMSAGMERDLRYLGCELIQSASILLKLPQVAAATGQILYQRFYYCKSFVRYNFEQSAMACVNLASKIEEDPRRIRDVINVFHHLKQLNRLRERPSSLNRRPHPMIVDQKYVAIKNEVIKSERRVLKELGFCVHVKHPHKLIVSYLQALGALGLENFLQQAWNYMNDSLRSDLFLRYAPEVVACACIHLASLDLRLPLPSVDLDIKLPDGSIQPRRFRWWELFAPDDVSVPDVCRLLLRLYSRRHKPKWEKLEAEINTLKHALLEKQAANKIVGGVENTPNPHATPPVASNDRKQAISPKDKTSSTGKRSADYYSRHEKREFRRSGKFSNGVSSESKNSNYYQDAKRRHRHRNSQVTSRDSPSSSDNDAEDDRRRNRGTVVAAAGSAGRKRRMEGVGGDEDVDADERHERHRRRRQNSDVASDDRRRRRDKPRGYDRF